jgi:hypothetical protein
MYQAIETFNTLPLAGKTVTFSAWVAGTVGKFPGLGIDFSTTVDSTAIVGTWTGISPTSSTSLTSSGTFQKITYTFDIPSTAKTIRVALFSGAMANTEFLSWSQIQLEVGSVATPYAPNGATQQAELAACQRYYWRANADASNPYALFCPSGYMSSTTAGVANAIFPIQMRVVPTSADFSNIAVQNTSGAISNITAFTLTNQSSPLMAGINVTTGATTANLGFRVIGNNNAAAYVGFSAEL